MRHVLLLARLPGWYEVNLSTSSEVSHGALIAFGGGAVSSIVMKVYGGISDDHRGGGVNPFPISSRVSGSPRTTTLLTLRGFG